MVYENTLTEAEQISRFVAENKTHFRGVQIGEFYNLGNCQFYENPLFLFTDDYVVRLFFCDQELDVFVYEKGEFKRYVKDDIFRVPQEGRAFEYLCLPYKKTADVSRGKGDDPLQHERTGQMGGGTGGYPERGCFFTYYRM